MPFIVVLPGERAIFRKYSKFCSEECLEKIKDSKLQCKCGEDISIWDWHWESDPCTNLTFSNNNRDVMFHPIYSSGTAAVKGIAPFRQNMHHYWEVKMISKLYGTDVMVGIATSKLDYECWKISFCSMLGIDANSYGYSYMGLIQHNKMRRRYGSKYGLGSIIGVHLDMCSGTMEYFLNRKPLGIAFRGLKNKEFYPMVSSTAAQSACRIACAVSKEPTLQILCLKIVINNRRLYKQYRNIAGLTRIYDREYFWIQPNEEEPNEQERLADLEEKVTLSLARSCKKPRRSWIPILRSHSDLEDSTSSSSDEETTSPLKRKVSKKDDTEERTSSPDDFNIYKDIFEYRPVCDESQNSVEEENSAVHETKDSKREDTEKNVDSGCSSSSESLGSVDKEENSSKLEDNEKNMEGKSSSQSNVRKSADGEEHKGCVDIVLAHSRQ